MTKTKLRNISALIIGVFLATSALCQVKPKEFKLLKNKYPNDDLIVLNKKQLVKIATNKTGIFITSTHLQEKLYLNTNAINYAKESVPYSDFYKIVDIKAKTILPGKRKWEEIIVTDFKDQDVLDEAIFADDSKTKTFIYPSLQTGAISQLNYKINISDPRFLSSYFFAGFDPIEKCELVIEVDNNIAIEFEYFNTSSSLLNYKKQSTGKTTTHTWVAKSIPKMNFEEGAPNVKYYVPHVITYVKSYQLNGNKFKVLSTVDDLYDWYWGFVDHLEDEDNRNLTALVDSLVKDKESDLKKVESIYSWVQKNIKYIAFEQGLYGFIPREASQVYSKRYGDCKDMANVVRSLLKLAGIKSYLTWVGTRDIPYSYNQVPTPAADNHMIATYIENGNYYFLDATNQYVPFGLPSSFIQGKEALIGMGKNNYEIVKIPEIGTMVNANIDSIHININGDLMYGNASSYLTGYNSEYLKGSLDGMKIKDQNNALRRFYEKGSNQFKILNSNISEDNYSLNITYDFELDNYLKKTENEIFLNPHLDKIFANGTIKTSRNQSIEKGYKSFTRKVVKIKTPENYEPGFIPENKYFDSEEFGFALEYTATGNEIILTQELYFNLLVMPKDKFPQWNQMVRILQVAYNEVITFKLNQQND